MDSRLPKGGRELFMKNKIAVILAFTSSILTAVLLLITFHLNARIDSLSQELISQRLIIVDNDTSPRIVMDTDNNEVTFTMLDKHQVPRFQAVMDNQQNMNLFLFDVNGDPRQGYFSQHNGQFVEFEDKVEVFHPADTTEQSD